MDSKSSLHPLLEHLDSLASCVNIDLHNPAWFDEWDIPNTRGWYFVRTDAPVEVLRCINPPPATYLRKKDRAEAKVKNINIPARAARYTDALAHYWNVTDVYSGMAAKLRARAKEHTCPDPGTGGLALGKYPELRDYNWVFGFVRLDRLQDISHLRLSTGSADMLLRLGEQAWRARHGWPLLCGH